MEPAPTVSDDGRSLTASEPYVPPIYDITRRMRGIPDLQSVSDLRCRYKRRTRTRVTDSRLKYRVRGGVGRAPGSKRGRASVRRQGRFANGLHVVN